MNNESLNVTARGVVPAALTGIIRDLCHHDIHDMHRNHQNGFQHLLRKTLIRLFKHHQKIPENESQPAPLLCRKRLDTASGRIKKHCKSC